MAELIHLKCGDWKAEIAPFQAMSILKLSFAGEEIIRSPAHTSLNQSLREEPFLYGTPLLFPAGRVRNGELHVDSEIYQLPVNEPLRNNHLHGRFFNAPFQVTVRTDTRITAVYRNSDGTRFPLDMEIENTCILEEIGIIQMWTFRNKDRLPIPVSFALHTAFCRPSQFAVQIGKKWELDEQLCATGRSVRKSPVELRIPFGIEPPKEKLSGMYEMKGPARIGRFLYEAQPPFDTWVIYNDNGAPDYLCVEPQCGIGLGVERRPPHMLAVGESMTFRTRLSL